jgi:drug/metabolite transporter (DMT)-like permease
VSAAYLYASLTVLFWSTAATAFKIALRDLSAVQLLLVANVTSLLVFVALLVVRGRFSELGRTNLAGLALSALQGLLNPFGYYLILFKAYGLLPAQVAQPANFVWPIVLMLLSVPLLKQPIKVTGVLALLISFTGVVVLASQGSPGRFTIVEPLGLALALLSSVVWALFWILNLRDKRDSMVRLLLSSLFSAFYILVVAWATGDLPSLSSKCPVAAVYVGLFEMGITYALWLKALELSESTGKIGNFVYLTPFLSLVFIHFVLGERLYYTSVMGLCLIVGGIFVGRTGSRPR